MRAGLQRYADMAALVDLVAKFGHIDQVCLEVGLSTHAEEVYSLSVDGVLDLVLVLQAARHTQVGAEHANREDVIGIQGGGKLREDSSNSSYRHLFQMDILRGVLPNTIGFTARRNVHVPHGQRTDSSSGVHIALQQHWRNPQNSADIVKAVGRIVRRQKNRGIDFECQQIANRVAVFGAVQTTEQRATRIRVSGGRTIEFGREPGHQTSTCRVVRPGDASWRHHSDPHLADDLFPSLRVLFNMGEIQRVERQTRGLRALVMAGHTILVEGRAVILSLPGAGRRRTACS